jgi:hypothetical protein
MLVAQHWLLTMLFSVAVGVALGYPTVFLSDNPTAGFTSIPRHVWTSARSVDVSEGQKADVEMRQIWVHGSYMRALEKDVLKSALTIQQSLIGGERPASTFSEFGDHLNPSELSWGYHSPLMYCREICIDDKVYFSLTQSQGTTRQQRSTMMKISFKQ